MSDVTIWRRMFQAEKTASAKISEISAYLLCLRAGKKTNMIRAEDKRA